jgi:hypothetical protein
MATATGLSSWHKGSDDRVELNSTMFRWCVRDVIVGALMALFSSKLLRTSNWDDRWAELRTQTWDHQLAGLD